MEKVSTGVDRQLVKFNHEAKVFPSFCHHRFDLVGVHVAIVDGFIPSTKGCARWAANNKERLLVNDEIAGFLSVAL